MRGKRAHKRKPQRDEKYNNTLVARVVNKIMQGGRKTVAQKIVYSAMEDGAKKSKLEPVEFLEKAINNVKPALEIRSRRVGGANYSVPVPVSPIRQETLAVRWIVDAARGKSGKALDLILMNELLSALNGEGDVIRKKVDVERQAEANKAFAHFRW